jgi:hypothetical protein
MSKRIGKYKVSKREDLLSLANGGTIDGKMVWGSETLTEDGDAANPNIPITIMDHDGDEGITLADGTEVGQLKIFISSTNNTVTLTPATTAGAYSTIATTDIGTSFSCVWSRASGATANASTVASYPVLA